MSKDEQRPPAGVQQQTGRKSTRWFKPNRFGPGWHPGSWQGWLVIGVIVAAVVIFVVLFRTGVL